MDVLFVDVGFGACNLILTGSGKAIVIDGGERSCEPLTALHYLGVKCIQHLIVSHWHDDHVGGAAGILDAYRGKVDTVWYPPGADFQKTDFWQAVSDENNAGRIPDHQIRCLTVQGQKPTKIWSSGVQDADLHLASPSFIEVQRGVASNDQNATSGVLILRVGAKRVVFAGDATLNQWQQIHQRMPVPFDAEVIAVPHHAGIIWPKHWNSTQIAAALRTLYTEIVRPKVAVISVGTRPGSHHPRVDVIHALRATGATVMCTQMTSRCTSDLEAARSSQTVALPVIVPGGRSSAVSIANHSGHPNHVACAGTVLVEILATGRTIQQLAAHQAFVGTIPNLPGTVSMCRA